MKAILTFLCIIYMLVCAWAKPTSIKPGAPPTEISVISLNICPIPMCMQIQQPCDNIQMSYMTIGGNKCPMCAYCASPSSSSGLLE
ncbi:unnamed protein product [Adineta ricciae]|uniref:Uncharacterized protein n=1 Tax=Adineta ricciae TaxID=249248 RepID=A0A814D5L5_ADIRI|nr:unnamed protein product [Adineta ricciae]CAF1287588.1 unnamed protein product [Adineta ricciae]